MNDLHFSSYTLRTSPLELQRSGQRIKLRRQALQVLKLLLENTGDPVPHTAIRQHLWGERAIDHAKAIPLIIRDIRGALGETASTPILIETIPREGYRFVGTVKFKSKWHRLKWPLAAPFMAVAATLGLVMALPTVFTDSAETTTEINAAEALFLKGTHLLHKGDTGSLDKSEEYFQSALLQNSNHANSIAGLAEIAVRRDQYDQAKAYALAAMDIEDTPRAHLVNAMIAASKEWDWETAQAHTSRALTSSNQRMPEAWSMQAMLNILNGDHAAAIVASNRAYRLDPVSALTRVDHGWFHYYAGEFSTAYDLCTEAATLETNNWPATYCQFKAASLLQDASKTLQAAQAVQKLWNASAPKPLNKLAQSLEDFNRWHIEVLEAQHKKTGVLHESLASDYMRSGQKELALDYLRTAAQQRSKDLPLALKDPVFGPIRAHPEFMRLVKLTCTAENTPDQRT